MQRGRDYDDAPRHVYRGLYVGSLAAANNSDQLRKHGILYVHSCVSQSLLYRFPGIEYQTVEIVDVESTDLTASIEAFLELARRARAKDAGVLVHCLAGVSRSVALAMAALIALDGHTLDEAERRVKACRPQALPNPGFRRQLERFAQARRETS